MVNDLPWCKSREVPCLVRRRGDADVASIPPSDRRRPLHQNLNWYWLFWMHSAVFVELESIPDATVPNSSGYDLALACTQFEINKSVNAHFADDFILENNVVPYILGQIPSGRDLELVTGHEVMQKVSHLGR